MKICIIDDDESVLTSLKLALSKQHEVTAFSNAAFALEHCASTRPDLLILDYQLGTGTGLEIYEYLLKSTGPIPTILITGHGSKELAIKSVNLHLRGFLEKPIDRTALFALIDNINGPQAFKALPQLNEATLDAKIGTQQARLTRTEFQILKTLVDLRGQSINRDELSKLLWNDSTVSKNTLDTHMSNLRAKLPILRERIVARVRVGFSYQN